MAAGLILPTHATAQFGTVAVGNEICARSFLSACAVIEGISINALPMGQSELVLTIRNSSDLSSEDVFASSFFGSLLLQFSGSANATDIGVTVGSASRNWRVRNNAGNMVGVDWSEAFDKQGSAINGIYTGETAVVTITFDGSITMADLGLWTVKMQAIGSAANCAEGAGECSDWSVVPEPVTMVLLATGLAGVGGASALRRRRRNFDIETE